MMPHPLFAVLGVVLLAAATSMMQERTPRERVGAAARTIVGWSLALLGGGWLMHWIHG